MKLAGSYAQIIVVVVALAMRLATTPTANISYLVIAGYALFGRAQAIHALALSWLFSLVNPGLAAEATFSSIGRYVVLGAAALSVLLRSGVVVRNMRIDRLVLTTLLLGVFIVIHSVLFSPIIDVSILKGVSWTMATTTLLAAWSGFSVRDRNSLAKQLIGGLIVLMLVSLPLLLLPVGYLRNGSGFQGVLSHPQAFGPTMALLAAWAGGVVLGNDRPAWSVVALLGASLVLIVLSEARTAGLAVLLGIAIAGIAGQVLTGRTLLSLMPGLKSSRLHLLLFLAVMGALLSGSALSERLDRYLSKSGRSDATTLLDAYDSSRGLLIEEMWANIQVKPLTGIGFGIASDPSSMEVSRDPILGLPTGASVEKGVLPVAVLEELGIGILLVAFWLLLLIRRAARGGGTVALAVFFTALLLNMGENVLFSPGGFGLLLLILIGWATSERRETNTAHA